MTARVYALQPGDRFTEPDPVGKATRDTADTDTWRRIAASRGFILSTVKPIDGKPGEFTAEPFIGAAGAAAQLNPTRVRR